MKKLGMMALTTLLTTTAAHALTQKVEIDLNQAVLEGQAHVPLKRMLISKLGPEGIRGWTLTDVKVEAKSMYGQGDMSLRVGMSETLGQNVPGTPEQFESSITGFTTLNFKAPYTYRGENNNGPIQLLTRGIIKLDDVELTLKKQLNYDHSNTMGLLFTPKVEFKAQKLIGSSKSIDVNGHLKGIKLTCTKEKVQVDEVKIIFMNGSQIIIDEIDGKLKEGQTKEFALKGPLSMGIKKISISASSMKLFGGRGKIRVDLAK